MHPEVSTHQTAAEERAQNKRGGDGTWESPGAAGALSFYLHARFGGFEECTVLSGHYFLPSV